LEKKKVNIKRKTSKVEKSMRRSNTWKNLGGKLGEIKLTTFQRNPRKGAKCLEGRLGRSLERQDRKRGGVGFRGVLGCGNPTRATLKVNRAEGGTIKNHERKVGGGGI